MDDLEFRRRILSEPKFRDKELNDAIRISATHQSFVDEVLSLDARVEQAMKVDVPDDLADRILFNHSVRPTEQYPATKRMLAMAASVAFVAGLFIGQINWTPWLVGSAHAALASTAVEHVMHEASFIAKLDEAVTATQINAKLQPFSYQLNENFPYRVYYLNHCGFGPSNALHMVFQGSEGKVTLFITNIQSEQSIDFNKKGMSGLIVPYENSTIILVAEEEENMQEIASMVTSMIQPLGAVDSL